MHNHSGEVSPSFLVRSNTDYKVDAGRIPSQAYTHTGKMEDSQVLAGAHQMLLASRRVLEVELQC